MNRIEKIGTLEPFRCTERKRIVLVGDDGEKIKFIYVKRVALDSPYIGNFAHNNHEEHLLLGRFTWCQLFNTRKSLEVSWSEKDPGSLFVNLSLLPTLLNSACLHNDHSCEI